MNDLTIRNSATTMSSREIAELTGGSHDNVLKTVRSLIARGVVSGNETPYVHPQNGQTYNEFLLNYRDTMVVVSGYSVELRAKIIDRWQELESQVEVLPQAMIAAMTRVMESKFGGIMKAVTNKAIAVAMDERLVALVGAGQDQAAALLTADAGKNGSNGLPAGFAAAVGMTAAAAAAAVDHLIARLPDTTLQVDLGAVAGAASTLRFSAQVFQLGLALSPEYRDVSTFSAGAALQDAGAAHACRRLIRSDPALYPMTVATVAQYCDAIVVGTSIK